MGLKNQGAGRVDGAHGEPGDTPGNEPTWSQLRRVSSPDAVATLIKGLYALCGVLFLLDFVVHRHAKVPGESLFGFYAIAGFIAFTLIVLGAKQLRRLILRQENYYADKAVDSEAPLPAHPSLSGQGSSQQGLSGQDLPDSGDTAQDLPGGADTAQGRKPGQST